MLSRIRSQQSARSAYQCSISTSLVCAAALLSLAIAGCSSKSEEAGTKSPATSGQQAETPAPSTDNFRVALVMSGPKSDNGWNSSAAKALDAVQKELGLSADAVKSVDNQTDPTSQEKSLQDFASKKFTIVFGHGTEYETPALKIEANFPNTLFVISSGSKVGKNTMPIVFKLEDGAYLEGMLAAGMSKTGKIGSVGAIKEAAVEHVFAAFEKGAKTVNPKIEVIPPTYTGSWDDVTKAKQQTLALLNQGADVIMQDVDSAAQGVFNAVQEFNKGRKQAWALGTNGDQNASAPDVILASAPIYTDKAFVAIAKAAKAGTLKANDTPFGMKDGIIDFIINPALQAKITAVNPMLLADLDKTKKGISDGSIDITKANP